MLSYGFWVFNIGNKVYPIPLVLRRKKSDYLQSVCVTLKS